jgi:hypothetical protein
MTVNRFGEFRNLETLTGRDREDCALGSPSGIQGVRHDQLAEPRMAGADAVRLSPGYFTAERSQIPCGTGAFAQRSGVLSARLPGLGDTTRKPRITLQRNGVGASGISFWTRTALPLKGSLCPGVDAHPPQDRTSRPCCRPGAERARRAEGPGDRQGLRRRGRPIPGLLHRAGHSEPGPRPPGGHLGVPARSRGRATATSSWVCSHTSSSFASWADPS